jgi:uncharacterized protein YgfB (UPF0149 family)
MTRKYSTRNLLNILKKELTELKTNAGKFPSDLEKAVQAAIKETTAQLEKDHKFEKQLLLKDHDSEVKLKNQQIESLMTRIKDIENQLKQAYSKSENAENNSKEITLKAIQNSARLKSSKKKIQGANRKNSKPVPGSLKNTSGGSKRSEFHNL